MQNCKRCREEIILRDDLTASCFKHKRKFKNIIDTYLSEKDINMNTDVSIVDAIEEIKLDNMKKLFDLYLVALLNKDKAQLDAVKTELMSAEMNFWR